MSRPARFLQARYTHLGDFVPAVIFGFVGAEAGAAHNIGTKLVFNTTDEDFDALAVADNTYGAAEAAQLNSKHKILAMSRKFCGWRYYRSFHTAELGVTKCPMFLATS